MPGKKHTDPSFRNQTAKGKTSTDLSHCAPNPHLRLILDVRVHVLRKAWYKHSAASTFRGLVYSLQIIGFTHRHIDTYTPMKIIPKTKFLGQVKR